MPYYKRDARPMWKTVEAFQTLLKQAENKNTKVILFDGKTMLLRVGSFEDCNLLFNFPTISWCIANGDNYWREYVEHTHGKQYFIIRFDKINSADEEERYHAMIGFTLNKDNKLYAAHYRNDRDLKESFNGVVKSLGLKKCVLKDKCEGSDPKFDNTYGQQTWKVIMYALAVVWATVMCCWLINLLRV